MSLVPPSAAARARSRVQSPQEYETLLARSLDDPDGFWRDQASALTWFHAPANIVEDDGHGEVTWFSGGRLNASVNAVDRHARTHPDRAAIIGAAPDGTLTTWTFAELKARVGRIANALVHRGVRRGDRVVVYMPTTPQAAAVMLACSRIGAVHVVVNPAYSAETLRERIEDVGAELIVTADAAPWDRQVLPLKRRVDQAVAGLSQVRCVLVDRHQAVPVSMTAGRDHWLQTELQRHRVACPAVWQPAEAPLFIMHTSGSTGAARGMVHTTAGYLVWACTTFRYLFDLRPGDVHLCTADLGWITGHTYALYGPLTAGITTVLVEGHPGRPDRGRLGALIDAVQATTLYTAPAVLRCMRAAGDAVLARSLRTSLRVLGSVGERLEPDLWQWLHQEVGGGRCPIVDTWWQTETGGAMLANLPGALPARPGYVGRPMFGVRPVLLDRDGRRIEGEGSGVLAIAGTWPGQARTLYGDHAAYLATYHPHPGLFVTGDGAHRDAEGYFAITGRVDDVLTVGGHRLGPAELEDTLCAHDAVLEAAVVATALPDGGEQITVFIVPAPWATTPADDLRAALVEQLRLAIGPIATPGRVWFVSGLPRTRTGKLLRRVLRHLCDGGTRPSDDDLADIADPSVVDEILEVIQPDRLRQRAD